MSKILENKQIIHIVCEAVVIFGLVIHFSKKNKKLTSYIEDVEQRLQEQEELIQKHEQIIGKLIETINNMTLSKQHSSKKLNKPSQKKVHTQPPLKTPVPVLQQRSSRPKIDFYISEEDEEDEEEDEEEDDQEEEYSSDEDLDAEIAEELQELEIDLKKND